MVVPDSQGRPDARSERQAASATHSAAVQFVAELAGTLSRAGAPVGIVQQRAGQIALQYGVPDARVVLIPNLTLAAQGRGMPVELDTTTPSEADLRRNMPTIRVLLPIGVAALVSFIAFLVAPDRTAQESLRALIL